MKSIHHAIDRSKLNEDSPSLFNLSYKILYDRQIKNLSVTFYTHCNIKTLFIANKC